MQKSENNRILEKIARNFGTPSYVFFEERLKRTVEQIREKLPGNVRLCFAMKANPFLSGILAGGAVPMVDRLEVCSPGEYEICMREEIPPERLVVSGVSKTLSSMKRIMSYSRGEGIYTIESEQQYEVLKTCAKDLGKHLKVLLRLSAKNQFGMSEDTLERVLAKILEDKRLEPIGIHYYAGTQKKTAKISAEIKMLEAYAKKLSEEFGFVCLELEYGPGLSVPYFENEKPPSGESQLDMLGAQLAETEGYETVTVELGRFIAADCGCYLTEIVDMKRSDGVGYIIVDGGIHQINYYGQLMGMKKPYMSLLKLSEAASPSDVFMSGAACGQTQSGCDELSASMTWTVCGSLCTANDVLVRDMEAASYELGDVLVFERCGAYSMTEGMSLFLSRDLPQVLFVREDESIEVMRRHMEINVLNGRNEGL